MEWVKYSIHINEESEDLISAMLAGLGITGIEIEDKRPLTIEESGGYFGEVIPEQPSDDHLALVSFYIEENENQEEVLAKVKDSLLELSSFSDIGEGKITVSKTAEEDWRNNWKKYFHSFYVDDIEIIPSWENEAPSGEASFVLHIDPGTAFGTGKHESTQLAIRALRKYLKPGMKILDVGTGSGILGIVALKCGAASVFGTDIDSNVTTAVQDNLQKNDLSGEFFHCEIGNLIDDPDTQEKAGGGYDIAVANIIAEILAPLTKEIPKHLKKGGFFLTSGILVSHASIVRNAMKEAGLRILEEQEMGEWESIAAVYE